MELQEWGTRVELTYWGRKKKEMVYLRHIRKPVDFEFHLFFNNEGQAFEHLIPIFIEGRIAYLQQSSRIPNPDIFKAVINGYEVDLTEVNKT